MKKKIFLLLILGGVLLLGLALYSYFKEPAKEIQEEPGDLFPSLISTSTPAFEAGKYSFLEREDAKEDLYNPGYYHIGYQPEYNPDSPGPPYLITYTKETGYFNIVLLSEPIGETRRAAEQFLKARLGLSEDEMCSINYSLGAPVWVNSTFAGVELGFSFCPGAVPLP
ncbi:MAG: hypothetical protein QOE22_222 [Candidatus Parcubacteria bacterium]|jgi:hypothetical protein|nr:hypothetical protein [Candidatus Parcubacteria bacterium]